MTKYVFKCAHQGMSFTPKAIQDRLDEFEAECKSDYPHALQALWNELERQDALHYY